LDEKADSFGRISLPEILGGNDSVSVVFANVMGSITASLCSVETHFSYLAKP